jgi:hypothetical protein
MTDYEEGKTRFRILAKVMVDKFGPSAAHQRLLGGIDAFLEEAHRLNPARGKPAVEIVWRNPNMPAQVEAPCDVSA